MLRGLFREAGGEQIYLFLTEQIYLALPCDLIWGHLTLADLGDAETEWGDEELAYCLNCFLLHP